MFKKKTILFLWFSLIAYSSFCQENTPILCADGIDNDGDGLTDCEDSNCASITITDGCSLCKNDGTSFADTVIEYNQLCNNNEFDDPQAALGAPNFNAEFDGSSISLTEGGFVKLSFTNNLIVNSGNSDADIWIFETGSSVEACNIELKPFDQNTIDILNLVGIADSNNDGYYEFGSIAGAISYIDIDVLVGNYRASELKFDAIQIIDIQQPCYGKSPGADIDAVCALSSIEVDCAGVNNGNFVTDECGECLAPEDPAFNQSCIDCAGVTNGNFVLDECGQCLAIDDVNFNQSCVDCNGLPNGNFILDECGECLAPNDPAFNQSCIDCAGLTNGNSAIDECGQCLPTNAPTFNQSCADCAGKPNGNFVIDECNECLAPNDPSFNISCLSAKIFIPNAFSPNNDGINDLFAIYSTNALPVEIKNYQIYNRWGQQTYIAQNFNITDNNYWWNGKFKNKKQSLGVFTYYIEVKILDRPLKIYKGQVTLVR